MYRIQLLAGGRVSETFPVDSIDVAVVELKAEGLLIDNPHGADEWRIINEFERLVKAGR